METEIIFETKNLTKQFGALVAVDDVSMKVRKNSLHAIIGPNGAGKSTLFKIIAGFLAPDAGRVRPGGARRMDAGTADGGTARR